MGKIDYYQLLGVPPTASDRQIQKAYFRLMRKYHPDVWRGDPAVATLTARTLNEAYEVLKDPGKRQAYDLSRRLPPPRSPIVVPPGSTPSSPTAPPTTPERVVTWSGDFTSTRPKPPPDDMMGSIKEEWHRIRRDPSVGEDPELEEMIRKWRKSFDHVPPRRPPARLSRKTVPIVLFFVLSVSSVGIGLTLTYPVSHSFGLELGLLPPGSSPPCTQTEDFPKGAQVTFTWLLNTYEEGQNSSGVVFFVSGPSSDPCPNTCYTSHGGGGNDSFTSAGGVYTFETYDCESWFYEISGSWTAPLV